MGGQVQARSIARTPFQTVALGTLVNRGNSFLQLEGALTIGCTPRRASLWLEAELVPSFFLAFVSGVEAALDESNATCMLNEQDR
jgi:hypothetical protein